MTLQTNGTAAREMTVTVQVLVVDGTRRMSHKFFEQIPRRKVIDADGQVVDGAELWGRTSWDPDVWNVVGVQVVWALDGGIYVADETATDRQSPRTQTIARLYDELPQLYVGG